MTDEKDYELVCNEDDTIATAIDDVIAGRVQPPNFRSSILQALDTSPLDFLIQSFQKKDTAAMRFGRAFHSKLLTPKEFDDTFWSYPPGVTGVSKVGKEFAQGRDKSCKLSQAEMSMLMRMYKSVMSITDPDLKQYLDHPATYKEWPMQWVEPDSGITCTGRTDMFFVFENGVGIFDFKTTDKPLYFEQVIFDSWYHVQSALYIEGVASNFDRPLETVDYFIVAVSKSYPYSVMTFELSPETIAMGMAVYKRLASLYKKCSDTHCWPGVVEYNHYLTYPESWGDPSEIKRVRMV